MTEKTNEDTRNVNAHMVEPLAIDNTTTRGGAGPKSPPSPVPNVTVATVRRRYVRHQRKMTYHYHHAP